MEKKAIGVIGGMGPLATVGIFRKIVLHTRGQTDQEHLRVLIDNNTAIPDRTEALLHGGGDPAPEMVKSARLLERMGAGLLVIPCNTAHNFYGAVQGAVDIPVLHMLRLTARDLGRMGVKCAGLLATDGTVRTGAYQEAFAGTGIGLLTPDAPGQQAMMDMVYRGVKAGNMHFDISEARRAMEDLLDRGAETLVLGCTELPLAFALYHMVYPAVDPTLVLALEAIRQAGGEALV